MPATYGGISFAGCPRPFLPILREMRRFPRPYIYWDPFRDEPPGSWPDAAKARAAQEAKGGQPADFEEPDRQGGSEGGLRDARHHCKVTGLHYTKVQRASALREVTEEEWVAGFAEVAGKNRKEPVKDVLWYWSVGLWGCCSSRCHRDVPFSVWRPSLVRWPLAITGRGRWRRSCSSSPRGQSRCSP